MRHYLSNTERTETACSRRRPPAGTVVRFLKTSTAPWMPLSRPVRALGSTASSCPLASRRARPRTDERMLCRGSLSDARHQYKFIHTPWHRQQPPS